MINQQMDFWRMGNTGVRNPLRIQEGFKAFADSDFVGNIRGKKREVQFESYLNEKKITQNKTSKDGTYARKWRLMFERNGFIYPKLEKKDGQQKDLGDLDTITPMGREFLHTDSYPAVQDFFLRAMTVEQIPLIYTEGLFSPLRWVLAVMLELEKRTGSSELKRIEFQIWVQTTDPSCDLFEVVSQILDLRAKREKAPNKKRFDGQVRAERGKYYDKKLKNFTEYDDMNLRYLFISGLFQHRGKGLVLTQAKHALAEQLAKTTANKGSLFDAYKTVCEGPTLPTDNIEEAKKVLNALKKQMKNQHITIPDLSDLSLDTASSVNIARHRLEEKIEQMDELKYAQAQPKQWKEISDYMTLLIKGGGSMPEDNDTKIEVPAEELPVYLEWTLWRAALAIDHLVNQPDKIRGFTVDSDFLPVSVAGGGRADLYWEFADFTILTEVTMTTSSTQEGREGEPVRRHVSDAVLKYNKPVYGLFIAVKIDINTAETFRQGIWYTKNYEKQRLDILPLSLAQFQKYFNSLFKSNKAEPDQLKDLILECEKPRDSLEAPEWELYIDNVVNERTEEAYINV